MKIEPMSMFKCGDIAAKRGTLITFKEVVCKKVIQLFDEQSFLKKSCKNHKKKSIQKSLVFSF